MGKRAWGRKQADAQDFQLYPSASQALLDPSEGEIVKLIVKRISVGLLQAHTLHFYMHPQESHQNLNPCLSCPQTLHSQIFPFPLAPLSPPKSLSKLLPL